MARDTELYRRIGPLLSDSGTNVLFDELVDRCTKIIYQNPPVGRLRNAVEHMWGYVSDLEERPPGDGSDDLVELTNSLRRLVSKYRVAYLWASTAVSDLDIWARFYSSG